MSVAQGDSGGEFGSACRVLLVDDRSERRSMIRIVLQSRATGVTVVGEATDAATAVAAVAAVGGGGVDAAVVEIQMPEGHSVIAALRAASPALVIVVCSFQGGGARQVEAMAAGADAYLTKPVSPADLLLACRMPRPAFVGP